jgi:hypothetical protein
MDLHTDFAGMLRILMTYGPHYLTPQELKAYLDRQASEYYRLLGKSVFLARDQKFWDYHKSQLVQLGFGFSRARLARATLANLCGAALRPKDTIDRILKSRSKQRLAGGGHTPVQPATQ